MDDRDQVIYDCPHALDAGRGYGDMSLRCTDITPSPCYSASAAGAQTPRAPLPP